MTLNNEKKPNLNFTNFSSKKSYSIEEVAKLTCHSIRTINENWRKEGLPIKKGKIKGKDIIDFLKNKKAKREIGKLEGKEYCCFKTKQKATIPLTPDAQLLYKNNRFKLLQANANQRCQNLNCKYRNQNSDCKVCKIIGTKLALKLYEEFFKHNPSCISVEAKEKLNELMNSSTSKPSLMVKNSSLTSNTPTVDFNNKTTVESVGKQIITQDNLQTTKDKAGGDKPPKRRALLQDELSLKIVNQREEEDKKKYYSLQK